MKVRLALCGPTGSGKTYSGLSAASGLGDRIAVIDTENRSASRYADKFNFEVVELEDFAPENYVRLLHEAENEFDVLFIDSLSHAWMGKGGVLEMVDKAGARAQGNNFAGWRTVTPKHNELVDALIRCKCHLIVTMRSKMEYVLEEDGRGKKVPRKVGMAPVQRDGLEYEFDIVGDMDLDNRLLVSKSRCSEIAGGVIEKPSKQLGERLRAWAETGEAPTERPPAPSANGTHNSPEFSTFDAYLKSVVAEHASEFPSVAAAWTMLKPECERLGLGTPAALRGCRDLEKFAQLKAALEEKIPVPF